MLDRTAIRSPASHRPSTRALKIAFRVGRFPTLSETFVARQVAGMVARGHDVSVLADEQAGDPATSPIAFDPDLRIATTRPRRPALARLQGRLPWRVRRGLEAAIERRACAAQDVVVCNFGWFGAALAQATRRRRRRAKLVTIFHGDDVSRALTSPRIYDDLFAQGDLFLAVSEMWRARLIALGAPPQRTFVHRMGVDLSSLRYTPRPASRPVRRIVTVGRLVEKKGTEFLLRALARARREEPDLELTIVGTGPLEANLKALASSLGLDDAVRFRGALPHDAVRAALAEADVFALPSVTAQDGDMEGIPVSLMEAMAAGLPVVSTRHSGIPELIGDGEEGLLAPERDSDTLADHLVRLVRDGDARAGFTEKARRRIEAQFDNDILNDRLEAMLLALADGSRPAGAER
ncbi:MAG: glycosyltransferase [Salinarimonas sp.]